MTNRITGALRRARTYIGTYGARAFAREVLGRGVRLLSGTDVPNRFHIEISNTCNFSCEYCVLREGATGDKVMSEATFSAILPHLRNAASVTLSGLAEPLMHPRFSSYLARVREAAPHAVISIDTNASLLTRELAEAMISSRLDMLVFSLDGVDEALVDGIRQGGSLQRVLDNIRMLNDVKREGGSERPSLAATIVLQRKNPLQLPEVVRLASTLGVRMVSVNGLEPYDDSLVAEAIWADPAADTESLAATVREAADIARASGIELRLPSPRPTSARCTQVNHPIVLADGTVVPCSVLAYPRERFLRVRDDGSVETAHSATQRVSFGNTNEQPLADIWRGDAYREFRTRVLAGDFPETCGSCLMKHDVICANEPVTPEEFVATLG